MSETNSCLHGWNKMYSCCWCTISCKARAYYLLTWLMGINSFHFQYFSGNQAIHAFRVDIRCHFVKWYGHQINRTPRSFVLVLIQASCRETSNQKKLTLYTTLPNARDRNCSLPEKEYIPSFTGSLNLFHWISLQFYTLTVKKNRTTSYLPAIMLLS